jgi:hypothetical protein
MDRRASSSTLPIDVDPRVAMSPGCDCLPRPVRACITLESPSVAQVVAAISIGGLSVDAWRGSRPVRSKICRGMLIHLSACGRS